jgi:hypothetical protein
MQRSEQINELAGALCKAQGAIEGAKKDSVNPHFKSAYADLASVWEAVRGPLTTNGLAVTQWLRTVENGLEVETVLMHTSGQYMSGVLWLPLLKLDAQAVGSASSYGRRYALMAALGVAPIDDDGEGATSHKPGVPGSASGGADFRPAGPRQSSANGRRMANDDEHLIDDSRGKGTTGKPAAPDERAQKIAAKAKAWVDNAAATLRLSGQSVDSLSRFLSDHDEQIRFLEDHAPDQHERFFEAFNAASEAARALS